RISEKVLKSVEQGREDAQCIVAFTRPTPQLCLFQTAKVDGRWSVVGHLVQGIVYAGDAPNAAVFWGQSYYHQLPIERLTLLASHLILSAGTLNPAGISGLEIALCTPDGIRELTPEAIHDLRAKSAALDKSVGLYLLGNDA
ncbi:MAG: hypothetical protein WAN70_08570, partial [Terriglobales bacterium]